MNFNIDDLWKKVKETHPIALNEWIECFAKDEGEDAARREICETLTNTETWNNRSRNFLLRLISADRNGYPNQTDDDDKDWVTSKLRPRVQLALTFVEQMAECESTFVDFLRETLSVQDREGRSTISVQNVQSADVENANDSVRLATDQPENGNEI